MSEDKLGLFDGNIPSPKQFLQILEDSGPIVDICRMQSLIAVSYEQSIALWDLAMCNKPVEHWKNPDAAQWHSCLCSVGNQLWVASHKGDITALKFNPLKTRKLFNTPEGIARMRARHDNKLVILAGCDHKAYLRSGKGASDANGGVLGTLEGHEGGLTAVAFRHRQSTFATASNDCNVLVWDVYANE